MEINVEENFLQQFRQYWQTHFSQLKPETTRLIVAVSGGVDSIVLAFLLNELKFDFIVAHCNFHLRGEESDEDERFVNAYAQKLNKKIVVKDFDTVAYSKTNKISIEEAARDQRYQWFRELADEHCVENKTLPILVGHHANDNIETVLMNFFRGCGIAGLHGILPINNGIYRPLLFAKRNEIVRFAIANDLKWREDASNIDEKYMRNFLRHSILPELKENYPTIEDNLLENIQRFKEVENIYQNYIEQLKRKLFQNANESITIDIASLKAERSLSTIVYEIFKDFHFSATQTSELIKLLDAESGARLESNSHIVWKDRSELIIATKAKETNEMFSVEESEKKLLLPDGNVLECCLTDLQNQDENTLVLDLDKLQFPLQVRHWREGDFFYPNGMKGKKKLAKYFIDQKIPTPIKHQLWIVTSNEQIVWIVGWRADRRFLKDDNTTHFYSLNYRSALL